MSIQQITDAPAGFLKSQKITSLATTTPGATDYYFNVQRIEGLNVTHLGWGTVNAITLTLSFWVKSSLTGSFSGAFGNASFTRSYPFSYTISSANTWEQKTVTVPGDTTGTWATDTSTGVQVLFDLGSGSSRAGTANTWSANDYRKVTGSVNVIGTNGATFYITGVQLEQGSTATPFERRPYGMELGLCQRYLPGVVAESNAHQIGIATVGSSTSAVVNIPFQVTPRVIPTGVTVSGQTIVGIYASGGQTSTALTFNFGGSSMSSVAATSSGMPTGYSGPAILNAVGARILFTGCEL